MLTTSAQTVLYYIMIESRTYLFMAIAAVFFWAQTAIAQTTVFINEVDADTPGSDTGEFIELFDGGRGNTALDGLVIVLFNGDGDGSYEAFDLDNYSTDADGYFVLGNSCLYPPPDLIIPTLQNGTDAVALYRRNASDFPKYTAVTTDSLIDALVYDTNDTDDADLLILLNNGQPQVNENGRGDQENHSNQRLPNGSGGLRNTSTYDQTIPTPGAKNIRPPENSNQPTVPIYHIQGAGHISPYLNRRVQTSGIVTAVVGTKGFYLQDPNGDDNDNTSDGIFVYTKFKAAERDSVKVTGRVNENQWFTQIGDSPIVRKISRSNSLPSPVIVGAGGRQPPTEIIDDDSFTQFDPSSDGIDFYESLEGMLVTISGAQVVAPHVFDPKKDKKIFTVSDHGDSATGLNQRGGLTIAANDFNPERLPINYQFLSNFSPSVKTGDTLDEVTGVVNYNCDNFEVLPTTNLTVTRGSITRQSTTLCGDDNHLLIATYNVYNLDPNDQDGNQDVADGQFAAIAKQIVNNLNQPDIIALQEVQDNNGSVRDTNTTANQTLQVLIDSIIIAGGPTYHFIDNPPDSNNADGGARNGNIRVAFLYNKKRVSFVDFLRLKDNEGIDAFKKTRKSLQATFEFNGKQIILINNHFTSRLGSSSLFGTQQPPINEGFDKRMAQAAFINAHVDGLLKADSLAKIVVLGDFNEYQFEEPLSILEGTSDSGSQVLFNLDAELPETEKYSYIFKGNSQKIDHILVSRALKDLEPQFDVVHVNCEFSDAPSDHDPLVARLRLNP